VGTCTQDEMLAHSRNDSVNKYLIAFTDTKLVTDSNKLPGGGGAMPGIPGMPGIPLGGIPEGIGMPAGGRPYD
jgi:hypothetical protein